jgi:hypothetical protein
VAELQIGQVFVAAVPEVGRFDERNGGNDMAITLQQKRALFWGLGILTLFALTNLAWAQIAKAIGNCIFRS